MPEYRIEYNPTQWKVRNSTAKHVFMIGGLGSGKSFVLGSRAKAWAEKVYDYTDPNTGLPRRIGSLGLMVAPTKKVLRDSTLPQVMAAWETMGLFLNEHYVVNRLPPPHWPIEAYSPDNQSEVITFYWGSYLIFGGLDNYNKYRGPEYDYILIDEFRDVKEGAWDVLIGRLRGRCSKALGIKPQVFCVTTPPEDYELLEDLIKKPDTDAFFTTSKENERNLPTGYIDGLLESYDDITARREIYGELINANARPFAYAYSPVLHDYDDLPVYPDQTLWISFDFNVEPMTCVIGQKGFGWANIVDEIDIVGSPEDVCEEILYRYPGFTYAITGGHDGHHRLKVRGAPSPFRLICQTLGLDYNQDVYARRSGMELKGSKGSRALMNSVFQNFPKLRIDRKCEGFRADLRKARVDHTGELDKSRSKKEKYLDKLDCGRYLLETWFPKWFNNPRQYY
jgi:phage terminase large subunit